MELGNKSQATGSTTHNFKNRQCVEVWTQHTAKADGIQHDREAHLCIHVLWWAGLCWGAAGRWHNLPVVVLACQVGGRPFS